mmetsp:Transcript_43089/g.70544  ORF Transcript_43089/g.70544 Transcript_43089/m.70544 type:complete len:672 (+) Transcript_43089:90-2105(+)
MSNMMIGMVPVNGPLYSGDLFCEQHELMRCAHGQFGSGCTKMHRVRQSARARCWADAQGWLCPRLQLCTLNHVHEVNVSRLPWVYTLVPKPEGWIEEGAGMGRGLGWGFQHKQCSYCILSSGDSKWDESGPLWQRGSSRTPKLPGRLSRRSARSRGVQTTPGVSRDGDLDGRNRGGRGSRSELLNVGAMPFSPISNLAAVGQQTNGGSLTTTRAAAADDAATAAQQQHQQQQRHHQQSPRRQSGESEGEQPHQEGERGESRGDQEYEKAVAVVDTSVELVTLVSEGGKAILRVHFDAQESGGLEGEPIGQAVNPDISEGPDTLGAGHQGGGGTGEHSSVEGVIALMLHSALAAATSADDGAAAPPPPHSSGCTTALLVAQQESESQYSQLEEGGTSLETESSRCSEYESTSSNSEESSSEGNRVVIQPKRSVWVASPDRGVGEALGNEEGFKPAPSGRRFSRRLAKLDRQKEIEKARLEKQELEAKQAREDLLLQREALAAAAEARQKDEEAKGPEAKRGGQLAGRGRGRGAKGRGPARTPGGGGGRGLGLARGPGNGAGLSGMRGGQARGEPKEWLFRADEKNRDLDVKVRIACGRCGMLAHKPEECRLEKRFCHICLGHPEGSSMCKPRIAVQFLEKELEKWYPGSGYPPDEWMYGYATKQWEAFMGFS